MLKHIRLTPFGKAIVKNAIDAPRSSATDNTTGYGPADKYCAGNDYRGDFGVGGGGGGGGGGKRQ
jgi:hypothetical protein